MDIIPLRPRSTMALIGRSTALDRGCDPLAACGTGPRSQSGSLSWRPSKRQVCTGITSGRVLANHAIPPESALNCVIERWLRASLPVLASAALLQFGEDSEDGEDGEADGDDELILFSSGRPW
ncbi:hypothetical protein I7I51_07253 [Histoplasma capsulatum]|uniref:Uncharacterized protein n=1 Tax=Ajellomyces capsulatus TaxID=5037 RepID=A0A8A1MIT4_AJECA|nr:hypothetical protein I7I51_07253 [Histoplasma capsulatum]